MLYVCELRHCLNSLYQLGVSIAVQCEFSNFLFDHLPVLINFSRLSSLEIDLRF